MELNKIKIKNTEQATVLLKWLKSKGMTIANPDGQPFDFRFLKGKDLVRLANNLWKSVVKITEQNE